MDSAKEPGAKWTLESLKHVFETRGVTLLDIGDQRITGTEKYRYICACGRECARTPSNMLKGRHPCRDCATRNRTEKCKSQNEALRQARKRKHEETATEKAGKIEEKEQDPPKLQHRPRKMIYLGPRWPDPKPRREDFPSLSKHEWLNLQARWRTSTPEYKRANNERYKRRVQEEGAYWRSPECRQATLEKLKRAKDRRLSLLQEISVDGHYAYRDPDTGISSCSVPAKSCDIDHMDPNTILADGKRRKQACFSQLGSVNAIEMEISRNTADGRLLLQALCPQHHPKTWFQVAPKRAKG